MTLADLLANPKTAEELRDLALVFTAELRERLISAQTQYGSPQFSAEPGGPLTDGRYFHCADILTEIGPRGIYGAGFAHLDASRFNEIDVMPLSEAVAMLPAPQEP